MGGKFLCGKVAGELAWPVVPGPVPIGGKFFCGEVAGELPILLGKPGGLLVTLLGNPAGLLITLLGNPAGLLLTLLGKPGGLTVPTLLTPPRKPPFGFCAWLGVVCAASETSAITIAEAAIPLCKNSFDIG